MGTRTAPPTRMAWQGTLGQMKAHGTRLAQSCTHRGCGRWDDLNIDTLIGLYGPQASLWDRRPHCGSCAQPGHYMASPGPGSPFRPLRSGPQYEAARQAFLRSFGFSRRDLVRIKAMAEQVTPLYAPAALADLDVPVRVGACELGQEGRSTGRPLGAWAGRTLLWWPMHEAEIERWRRRSRGPKPV